MPEKPHLQVTAAVIRRDGKILIARRPPGVRHAGRWEFPGGKQEPGETLEDCIVREIREELEVDVRAERLLMRVDHEYETFSLTLHAFACRLESDAADIAKGGDREWVAPEQLAAYDLLPPDRPIAEMLRRMSRTDGR